MLSVRESEVDRIFEDEKLKKMTSQGERTSHLIVSLLFPLFEKVQSKMLANEYFCGIVNIVISYDIVQGGVLLYRSQLYATWI